MAGHLRQHSFTGATDHNFSGLQNNQVIRLNTTGNAIESAGNFLSLSGGTITGDTVVQRFRFASGIQRKIRTISTTNTTVDLEDYTLFIVTSATTILTNLIDSPTDGQEYWFKDKSGSAATNNFIISGGTKNVDGQTAFTANTNYSAIGFIYNGTEWNVF